jgi:hypothetical protein
MQTNFALMQHHKYGYNDIDSMIAWERQVYLMMLSEYIKEENDRLKLQQQSRR